MPRITGRDLQWVALRPDTDLVAGPLGIREPVGPALGADELAGLDLMLVPGLAVDRSGRRLGQGGGYYDRVLASVPAHADGGPMLVAVLFDDEVLDEVPYEAHDCRVDAVVTPERSHPRSAREPQAPRAGGQSAGVSVSTSTASASTAARVNAHGNCSPVNHAST